MNYADKAFLTVQTKPLSEETACKLDSKARLVLPLKIRDLLNVSYGDCVSIQIMEKNEGSLVLKIFASSPAEGVQFAKTSKNSWEKLKI